MQEQGICFDFIPLPESREDCARLADELERALTGILPPVRFEAMRSSLARWDTLTPDERLAFRRAMGWRRAMFLDDTWLYERIDLPADLARAPSRAAFAQWTPTQVATIRARLTQDNLLPEKADAAAIAYAERLLTLDLSRQEKPGVWVHHGAVTWLSGDSGIDDNVVIPALRLYPMLHLARTFVQTGDERYMRGAVELLSDLTWELPGNVINRCGGTGCRTHWGVDALDVAIRTESIAAIAGTAAQTLSQRPDACLLVWKILNLCGERGMEFWHKSCHNIVFFEPAALGELGFCFPCFKNAPQWQRAAQQRLAGALRGAILSDGANYEGALSYHAAYAFWPQRVVDAARLAGLPLDDDFRGAYERKRLAALELWAKVATPGRTLPPMGDCWPHSVTEALKRYGAEFGSPMALAVAGDDPAQWPAQKSFFLPQMRYAVMRSSWARDALWCGFNLRGFHYGHDHYDLLHLEVQAGDVRLLPDSGCIDYGANRERSRATCAHNALVVDGRNQGPGPAADIRWHTAPDFDWAEGLSLTHEGVLHRRAVCFLKPDAFLVIDRVDFRARGPRQCDFFWHLPADRQTHVAERAVRTTGGSWNLALDFACGPDWKVTQETGFLATTYLSWIDTPVARLSAAPAAGFNLATLIRPIRPGAAPDPAWQLERLPVLWSNAGDGEPIAEGRAIGLIVRRPGGVDHLLWCDPGYGEKRVGEWSTDGGLLLTREQVGRPPVVLARQASVVMRNGVDQQWSDVS